MRNRRCRQNPHGRWSVDSAGQRMGYRTTLKEGLRLGKILPPCPVPSPDAPEVCHSRSHFFPLTLPHRSSDSTLHPTIFCGPGLNRSCLEAIGARVRDSSKSLLFFTVLGPHENCDRGDDFIHGSERPGTQLCACLDVDYSILKRLQRYLSETSSVVVR